MTIEEELHTDSDSGRMMYAFSDLLEELKFAWEFLQTHLRELNEEDFFYTPSGLGRVCIAQHIGHLAYLEKEVGKKAEIPFSFRLDLLDDIFCENDACIKASALPGYVEIREYCDLIHQTFMDEVKYAKKPDLLFDLINQIYIVSAEVREILVDLGRGVEELKPDSKRVKCRKDKGLPPQYKLPVYAN